MSARVFFTVACLLAGLAPAVSRAEEPTDAARPFALVELFTSEGCSSCPPAEKLASAVAAQADAEALPVHVLAFHVDYWDRLGWRDRFASSEFSSRQRRYASALRAGVYTPQMVVNGRAEFVGSNAERAESEIGAALRRSPVASIRALEVTEDGADALSVRVGDDVEGRRGRLVLNVALAEDGIVSRVDSGENAGRRLTHDAIVRAFATSALTKGRSTHLKLDVPRDVRRDRAAIVAWIQDRKSMEVLAASRIRITSGSMP